MTCAAASGGRRRRNAPRASVQQRREMLCPSNRPIALREPARESRSTPSSTGRRARVDRARRRAERGARKRRIAISVCAAARARRPPCARSGVPTPGSPSALRGSSARNAPSASVRPVASSRPRSSLDAQREPGAARVELGPHHACRRRRDRGARARLDERRRTSALLGVEARALLAARVVGVAARSARARDSARRAASSTAPKRPSAAVRTLAAARPHRRRPRARAAAAERRVEVVAKRPSAQPVLARARLQARSASPPGRARSVARDAARTERAAPASNPSAPSVAQACRLSRAPCAYHSSIAMPRQVCDIISERETRCALKRGQAPVEAAARSTH